MARFVRTADVVARRIAGELVLVPIAVRTDDAERRTANFYVLNGSGEVLWERLGSPADIEELTSELVSHIEVGAEQARGDVLKFLSELRESGAIVTLEPN